MEKQEVAKTVALGHFGETKHLPAPGFSKLAARAVRLFRKAEEVDPLTSVNQAKNFRAA